MRSCFFRTMEQATTAAPSRVVDPDSEEALPILQQVEFYFSNSNYPRDKFLRAQAATNEEGYVPLQVVNSFARLKVFGVDTTTLAAIMRKSTQLQVSEDGTKIKRVAPLPEKDDWAARAVYTKGWTKEAATIEEVSKVMGQFGTVKSVRIRKIDGVPKGSAFVEFGSVEEVTAAVTAGKVMHNGVEVVIKTKAEHAEEKKAESANKKGGSEKKQDDKKPDDKKRKAEGDAPREFQKGLVIRLNNIAESTKYPELKTLFLSFGKVKYLEFTEGESSGYARMAVPEEAAKAVSEIQESKKELNGKILEVSLLEGEEEENYRAKAFESKPSGRGRGGRGGRGRGGRGRGARGAKRQRF